jgi:hypothetical protein
MADHRLIRLKHSILAPSSKGIEDDGMFVIGEDVVNLEDSFPSVKRCICSMR